MAEDRMSSHVLIVEDERKLSELLADYLQAEGMRCSQVNRGSVSTQPTTGLNAAGHTTAGAQRHRYLP